MRLAVIGAISLGLGLCMAAPAAANEALEARVRLVGERVAFDVDGRYTNYMLTISGPEGYLASAEGARSAPTVRLADHGAVVDGRYQFQLTAATDRIDPSARQVDQSANGREPGAGLPRIGAALSGSFVVEDGRIKTFEQIDEPEPGDG